MADGLHGSLITSSAIPAWVRYLVPLVILGNIAIFLSSNLTVAGVVHLRVIVSGNVVSSDDLYDMWVTRTLKILWQQGIYALAILVCV